MLKHPEAKLLKILWIGHTLSMLIMLLYQLIFHCWPPCWEGRCRECREPENRRCCWWRSEEIEGSSTTTKERDSAFDYQDQWITIQDRPILIQCPHFLRQGGQAVRHLYPFLWKVNLLRTIILWRLLKVLSYFNRILINEPSQNQGICFCRNKYLILTEVTTIG